MICFILCVPSYISTVQTEGKAEEQILLKLELPDVKLEKAKISLGDLTASQDFTRYDPILSVDLLTNGHYVAALSFHVASLSAIQALFPAETCQSTWFGHSTC